ncbi:MAG: ADP-ribosylglycohydrolase family protein [Planctomycetaceae bacterium]|jgi:hypothetical protein|nr:ADP-ribosylglycohydrolase family protein [Planctomycetaceae bacterium]
MKKNLNLILFFSLFCLFVDVVSAQQEFRRLSVADYRDKMKAAWIGQIAGVCWGAPTEFKYCERTIPENEMPVWKPEMINNAFGQDDLYVEMTFLRTMEEHGFGVSQRQAGIDFANSEYNLWHANVEGRRNLRRGIAPPDSSHPAFNQCADDIDYQIEADFSGIIAPGMPEMVIELGNKFGRLMNYGDGLHAGQFVGGMYAEAYFETDLIKIIRAGLACIPQDSQYAEMVCDLLKWYEENPNNWETTWTKIEAKYQKNKDYRRFSCHSGAFNIDAKINGAYILVGLLYGKGDLDQTIIISTRCGQDSDCNPSNAAGILFATRGFSKLPQRFTEKLDETQKFRYTAYNVPMLLDVCEKLTRQAVIRNGGRVEKNNNNEEVFVIPVKTPKPQSYKPSWRPEPPADVKFTDEEKAKIRFKEYSIKEAVDQFLSGWKLTNCGADMNPGFRAEYRGKKNVVMTHPKEQGVACTFSRSVAIPEGKKTWFRCVVSHHDGGDWDWVIRVDGKEIGRRSISKDNVGDNGWATIEINLTPYAGKTIAIELDNAPNGWAWEAGYWASIEIESK